MRSVLISLLSLMIVSAAPARAAANSDGPAAPRRLLELEDFPICSLAADDTNLYFVTPARPQKPTDTGVELQVMSKSGGAPRRIFSTASLRSAPALDGGNAYFLGPRGALQRTSLAGGRPTTLVEPRRIAALIGGVRAPDDPELTPCGMPTAG